MEQTDVLVVGSGIGGLCCAALLAKYGLDVVVCESHSIPGGAAHGFERQGFMFDSGPSLYSGLSYSPSPNPLRQVLDAIGEDAVWLNYETWHCQLPEGQFQTAVGATQFCEVLKTLRGSRAVQEWQELQQVMAPLAQTAIALPPAAFRFDWGAVRTLGPFAPKLLPHVGRMGQLSGPFAQVIARVITDPFIQRWLDLLCFLLSGLPANGTSTAEMAFMFADWYRPNVQLDYPVGGSAALVAALVRGLQRHGGQLRLNSHVEQVIVEGDRAVGVALRSGLKLRAKQAVVMNTSIWDTLKLLPETALPLAFRQQRQTTPQCQSFMHLHLGIDGQDLPANLPCHGIFVADWQTPIDAPQNVVLTSIPSLLDPTLAPPGKHVVHVYTPGNEPYAQWAGLTRQSAAYQARKQERASILWQALEQMIPDVRSRCELELVGTPLTHARFLRRDRGTYGPAIRAGQALFPGPKTPISGLLCCGDSTFPGIGLPAVAASGMIAAHTLVPVQAHLALLREIGYFRA